MKVEVDFSIDQQVKHKSLAITGIVSGVSQWRANMPRVAVDYATTAGELKTEWFDADMIVPVGD